MQIFGASSALRANRSRIGYVPQRIAQADTHFPATVEEVVLSGRTSARGMFHRWTSDDHRATTSALDQLEIRHLHRRQIGHLSGGQKQRVFIARALASDPTMLILDEPTVGVDPASTEKFYTFLRELNERKRMTIVIVSHDLDVVAREVNSILCLNRMLVCHGSPRDVLTPELLAKLYGDHVKFIHHHHAR
jgi:zinc transport system ATP-binding protein